MVRWSESLSQRERERGGMGRERDERLPNNVRLYQLGRASRILNNL